MATGAVPRGTPRTNDRTGRGDAGDSEDGTWRATPDGVRVDVAGQTIPMRVTEVGDDVLRLVWPQP